MNCSLLFWEVFSEMDSGERVQAPFSNVSFWYNAHGFCKVHNITEK